MLLRTLGIFKVKQSWTLSLKEQDQYDGNSTSFSTLWRWEIVKALFLFWAGVGGFSGVPRSVILFPQ